MKLPEQLERWLSIGTCSWKYDSWKGLVYEKSFDYHAEDYLVDYAKHFRTVEVDQWFWSLFPKGIKLPDARTVRTYASSVPDDFTFTVKAPNSITLTHFYKRQPKHLSAYANKPNKHFLNVDLLERFLESLSPLGSKLGPVMFQFEYLNRDKMPSKEAFIERMEAFFDRAPGGYRYALESRNPNYLSKPFFDFLKRRGLGYVFIDGYYMPPIGRIFDANDTATSDFTVIRLHGGDRKEMEDRAGKKWNRIVEPQDTGLESAARIVRNYAGQKIHTFLNINNHFEGSAPLTAERFVRVLKETEQGNQSVK